MQGNPGFMSFFRGNNNQPQQSQPSEPPEQNNPSVTPEDDDINIWQPPENNGSSEGDTDPEPTNIDQLLDQHVAGLDFGIKIDPGELGNELQEGKTDLLQNTISQAAREAYKRAVLDIGGSFKQFENRIMDRVKQEVSQGISTTSLDRRITTQFGNLATDKDAGPILRAAAQSLSQRGMAEDDVVAALTKFTGKLGSKLAPTRSNPNRHGPPARGQSSDDDFFKLLTED